MRIRGIVRVATLEENPPGSDQIEMLIRAQGVRPEQPRLLVVPYDCCCATSRSSPTRSRARASRQRSRKNQTGAGS